MFENYDQAVESAVENAVTSLGESQWERDNEVSAAIKKKRKKIKRLKKKLRQEGYLTEEKQKKIKKLKKQVKKLQEERYQREQSFRYQLMQAKYQNDILRILFVLQMPDGKENLMKSMLGNNLKGVLVDGNNHKLEF